MIETVTEPHLIETIVQFHNAVVNPPKTISDREKVSSLLSENMIWLVKPPKCH